MKQMIFAPGRGKLATKPAYKVGHDNKDNRNRPRLSAECSGCWDRACDDPVGSELNQLFCQDLHPIHISCGPADVQPDVLSNTRLRRRCSNSERRSLAEGV